MNDNITRKKRGSRGRIERNIVLVVTADNNISEDGIYSFLNLNQQEEVVRIVRSNLTGKALKTAVKRYMKDYQLTTTKGDRVIYINDVEKEGCL